MKYWLLVMVLVVMGTAKVQAATVTLTDGTLTETSLAPVGYGVRETLGSEFNVVNGTMTFSGTMSRDPDGRVGSSAYNLGMTVGDLYFLVHPNFTDGTLFGAVRVDPWTEVDSPNGNTEIGPGVTTRFSTTDSNDIGVKPADDKDIYFQVILNDDGTGTNTYKVDLSITQEGVFDFAQELFLAQDLFGSNGSIDSFGALHVALGSGYGDAAYSGFSAHVSVPEVSATGALAAFGSLLSMFAFLYERRVRRVQG